ncbi:MAG TPA: hypothetical protein VGK67_33500 [Myxococcales bacterium]|jgi:hypothetical protein
MTGLNAILAAALSASFGATHPGDLPVQGVFELPPLRVGVPLLLPASLASTPEPAGGLAPTTEASRESGLVQAHRILKPLTAGALLLTVALGTLVAINFQTAFGDGRCASAHPIFGTYGCDALNIDHGVAAVLSTVLFTATSVLELTPEVREVPTKYPTTQRGLRYVYLVGFVLQPLMGIISSYPQTIGISPADRAQFSKVMRTIHLSVGYVTLAAFATSTVLEF